MIVVVQPGTLIINAGVHFSLSFVYLHAQLIEKVYCIYDDCNIEVILWERQKYCLFQLFTNVEGMNNISDLYSLKKKGWRKH